MRLAVAAAFLLPLVSVGTAARADLGPGETVVDGILADVTPAGLDFVAVQAPALVPSGIPVDDVHDSQSFGWCDMDSDVTNMNVELSVTGIELETLPDILRATAYIDVWINTQWDPFHLDLDVSGFLCDLASSSCDVWVDPTAITATMNIGLEIIDPGNGDPPYLDATISVLHNLDTAITSDVVQLSGCSLATLNDVLSFIGIDLVGLVLDMAAGDLFAMLEEDLPQELEAAIEDAFLEAQYVDTVDLLDVPVDIEVVPHDIDIDYDGLRVMVNSSFDAPLASCVEPFDPGGSPLTDNPQPAMDGAAAYHVGAYLSDDSAAAALYTLWRGGVLCYDLDPADLGFPLDTSFISLMVDEEDRDQMERVWLYESQPIQMRTLPKNAPELVIGGPHDVDAHVEDLGLEFFAQTQDRMARIMTIDADIDAGIDVLAPGDGSVSLELDIGTDDLDPAVAYNEIVPDLSSQMESNFSDIISGLLDTALDSLLDPDMLSFGPFIIAGMGIAHVDTTAAGPAQDWLGIEATAAVLDPGGIGEIGCNDEGGCDGGCDQGCQDESCNSSCDVSRNTRRVSAVWAGNLSLLLACAGVLFHHRRRNR